MRHQRFGATWCDAGGAIASPVVRRSGRLGRGGQGVLVTAPFLRDVRAQAVEDAHRILDAAERDLNIDDFAAVRLRLRLLGRIFVAARAPEISDEYRNLAKCSDAEIRRTFRAVAARTARAMELLLYEGR